MPMSNRVTIESPVTLHSDRKTDRVPELLAILRDGDLLSGRLFCAQVFDRDTHGLRVGVRTSQLPLGKRLPSFST